MFYSKVNSTNYLFIFEDKHIEQVTYDYLVYVVPKTLDSNSEYVEELTQRINNAQHGAFKISCIYSDQTNSFIIFIAEE